MNESKVSFKLSRQRIIEGRVLDRGTEIIVEGFSKDKLGEIVKKIGNVLGKRMGIKIVVDTINVLENTDYTVYRAKCSNDAWICFNFERGRNSLAGIGAFDPVKNVIISEVQLLGYNIAQTMDEVVDVLNGYFSTGKMNQSAMYESIEKSLNEAILLEKGRASKGESIVASWIAILDKPKNLLVDSRLSTLYRELFVPWAEENRLVLNNVTFNNEVKKWLSRNKLENRFARKTIIFDKAQNVTEVTPAPKEENEFLKIKNNTYKPAFIRLKKAVMKIVKGMINSVIVVGAPGIGKTTKVKEYLETFGAVKDKDYKIISGSVGGVKELVKTLYDWREDKIIVFDDILNLLSNKNMANLLYPAMENQPKRTITYLEAKNMMIKQKARKIPDEFTFTSGIIMLTNEKVIPKAIGDRAEIISIDLPKEEILNLINDQLSNAYTDVDMKVKEEVFEFLLDNIKDLESISFRNFLTAISNKQIAMEFGDTTDLWKYDTMNSLTHKGVKLK